MLSKEDCFILGRVSGPIKDSPTISILIDADDPSDYDGLDFILIEVNNSLIPFELLEFSVKRNNAQALLSGIDNYDQALVLKGAEVFLPLEALPKLSSKDFYLHEIKGFEILDVKSGSLGKIVDVFDLPQHTVASVIIREKEVLIPLRKDLIQKIDRAEKSILIDLPDGLVDMYMDL
ncbi:MAG: 16S rRNA processing protein RimM [Bacteroidia bacterium]|nr:16S rRNA processing protein RimM [Bacteroidia bacterium]